MVGPSYLIIQEKLNTGKRRPLILSVKSPAGTQRSWGFPRRTNPFHCSPPPPPPIRRGERAGEKNLHCSLVIDLILLHVANGDTDEAWFKQYFIFCLNIHIMYIIKWIEQQATEAYMYLLQKLICILSD